MSDIPPDKARKFLRAAVIGMVRGGLDFADAEREFRLMLFNVAKREFGSYNKAAERLGVHRNTIHRIIITTGGATENTPTKPEETVINSESSTHPSVPPSMRE